MTEMQIKHLLSKYIFIQQEIEILKNYESCYKEPIASKYKKKEFYINLLSSAIKILDEKERFVIETHLINQKTWLETTELYEGKCGILNRRSERTLKLIQSKALTKIWDFITKLPIEIDDIE